jgi:undecaprenyl-diphosphatase
VIPTWLQAVLLGLVQGATEFIPVSSSGHLVLVPFLLGWERPGLAFDVALHAGTALAILLYFRRELSGMLLAVIRRGDSREGRLYRRMAILLAVASVPVAVAGLLAQETFERLFESPPVAASFLLVTAGVLVGGEKVRDRRASRTAVAARRGDAAPSGGWVGTDGPAPIGADGPMAVPVGADPADPAGADLERLSWRHALIIGGAQVLALFPGMSRSGTTITAGVVAGLTRPAATRFAFLLALPALLGAMIVSLPELAEPGPYSGGDIAAGVTASFVAGYLAIAFLVRLVSRIGLDVFARYLVVAAAVGWGAWLLTG